MELTTAAVHPTTKTNTSRAERRASTTNISNRVRASAAVDFECDVTDARVDICDTWRWNFGTCIERLAENVDITSGGESCADRISGEERATNSIEGTCRCMGDALTLDAGDCGDFGEYAVICNGGNECSIGDIGAPWAAAGS